MKIIATYLVAPSDPTSVIERKLRELLQTFKNNNKIEEKYHQFFMCLNSRLSSFYALSKIHKQDIPLRPIVSFCGATLYNLSKFLKSVIAPLHGR